MYILSKIFILKNFFDKSKLVVKMLFSTIFRLLGELSTELSTQTDVYVDNFMHFCEISFVGYVSIFGILTALLTLTEPNILVYNIQKGDAYDSNCSLSIQNC